MRRRALSALCLLGALLLPLPRDARGTRRPGGSGPLSLAAPKAIGHPRDGPAEGRHRKSLAARAPIAARPNVCGETCCPGWALAPKTGKCTKAVCFPPCRNGGQCRAPQRCVCRRGFVAPHCEHPAPTTTATVAPHLFSVPQQPRAVLRWQPLTLAELQGLLRRREALGSPKEEAGIRARHLASRAGGGAGSSNRSSSSSSNACRPGHGPPAGPRPRGTRLLLPALVLLLSCSPLPGGAQRVKVFFTPMVCRLHCRGAHCTNLCERGNATTLYSGENAHPAEGGAGFRVFGVVPVPPLRLQGCVCVSLLVLHAPGWCAKCSSLVAGRLDPELRGSGCGKPTGAEGGHSQGRESGAGRLYVPVFVPSPGVASMVNVHVEHPPEASVTIHQVERVSDEPAGEANSLPLSRQALYSVLAQSSPRDPGGGYGEGSGFGYCFRQLQGGECSAPLPGLRTREICCRGAGVAWGVHDCLPCTHGDSAHHVISEAKGPCFRVLRDGGCSLPTLRNITKQICCCSRVGKAWGRGCERCPLFGSDGFKESCPAGPGYHYSASDLRFDTRFLGQDLPRVPLGRQPGSRVSSASPPPDHSSASRPSVKGWALPGGLSRLEVGAGRGLTGSAAPTEAGRAVCERSPQVCGPGRCIPRQGGYTCVCDRGYWLSPQGTHCVDIDECAQRPPPCTSGHCHNTPGSYRCSCPAGYRPSPPASGGGPQGLVGWIPVGGSGAERSGAPLSVCREPVLSPRAQQWAGCSLPDVDECRESPAICQPGQCENVPGGHRCSCPIGYQPGPLGKQCVDVDECQQSPPPCGSGSCENVPGGYRCLCPTGFRASLTENQCLDVDECGAGAPCGPQGLCINTEGSFRCQCGRGYRTGSSGVSCVDVNECLEGDFCFPRGECLNTEGSYTCLCAQGFATAPNGASCVDIDECQSGARCAGGHCANTEGSFDCYCPPGTRSSASKASCEDIDECQEYGAALCGTQRCENTGGSYRCVAACQVGYQPGTSGDCVDVDECQAYGARLCGEQPCENTPGSFRCRASCQSGYQPSASSGDCEDVDECRDGSLCGAHAVCHNLPGSFRCACDQGYESARGGRHCLDVDECQALPGVCGAAPCENVEGSFLCICPRAGEEFDPATRRCVFPLRGTARDSSFLRHPEPAPPPSGPSDSPLRECYYDPNAAHACETVLAWNATRQQCCCSLGHGWGLDCHVQECPAPGTAEHQALCPHGKGFAAAATGSPSAVTDVDECTLFSSQVCKGGVCVNKVPGYTCYCPNGYFYETQHLECIDNDECLDEEAEPCVGGALHQHRGLLLLLLCPPRWCLMPPSTAAWQTTARAWGLFLPRAAPADDNLAVCWQEVGPDLVCSRPRLDRRVTYTECCCLYGEAWSMDCALCPARDSDDFEALCNVLRPPHYGPVRPGSLGPPFEYGGGEFLPYGPEIFAPVPQLGPRPPDYDPFPRDSLYGPAPYEAPDFEDLPYNDARREGLAALRASGGLQAEECGILSGCENGHCVRVADGFTCDCYEGYRLDPTRMACLDIDECQETDSLCPGGRCLNMEGSYRCLCPRGAIPVGQPPRCIPAPRSQA
ncbi:hypothetical protein lerEdw1_009663 [Lerista edwardsae]|nr:hypothetical protein lerEdw1_009663 [Lerista edwardsae]